jgi:hypothetical protein
MTVRAEFKDGKWKGRALCEWVPDAVSEIVGTFDLIQPDASMVVLEQVPYEKEDPGQGEVRGAPVLLGAARRRAARESSRTRQ